MSKAIEMVQDLIQGEDGTLVNGIDRLHFTEWVKVQVTMAKCDSVVVLLSTYNQTPGATAQLTI